MSTIRSSATLYGVENNEAETPNPDYLTALAKQKIIPFECENISKKLVSIRPKLITIIAPAPYLLPSLIGYKNHDVSKWRSPAYSIGVRRAPALLEPEIPGPRYETRGMTRKGKQNPPKYSIVNRMPVKVYSPGRYEPEKHDNAIYPKAPSASIKGREATKLYEDTPGPKYAPEKVIGTNLPRLENSPAAKVKGRSPSLNFYREDGPGPGRYQLGDVSKTKYRYPMPILGKKYDTSYIKDVPAPSTYYPSIKTIGKRAPSVTFGIKHSRCMTQFITKDDNNSYIEQ